MIRYIFMLVLSLSSLESFSAEGDFREDLFLIESFKNLNSEDVSFVSEAKLVKIYEENKEVNYPYGIALMMYYFSKEEYGKVTVLGDEIKEVCMPVCYNSYNNDLLTFSVVGKLTSVFFSRYGYSLYVVERWEDAKDIIALGVETRVLTKTGTYSHFLSALSESSIKVKDYGSAERYLFLLNHFVKEEGTQLDYEKSIYEIIKLEVIRENYDKASKSIRKIKGNKKLMIELKSDPIFSEYINSKQYLKVINEEAKKPNDNSESVDEVL